MYAASEERQSLLPKYSNDDMRPSEDTTTSHERTSCSESSCATNNLSPTELSLSVSHLAMLYSPKNCRNSILDDDYIQESQDTLSLLDPYFDMTSDRMSLVFRSLLGVNGGRTSLSYSEFRQGLENFGISCANEEAFAKFVDKVDSNHSQLISQEEFETAVQKLKIAELFQESTIAKLQPTVEEELPPLCLVEYADDKIRRYKLQAKADLQYFFTSEGLPKWARVRWLNVSLLDRLNIKRMAIKYRLHPLAVEDTLELQSHEHPKFDRYGNHMFVVFPILTRAAAQAPRRNRSHSFSLFHDSGSNRSINSPGGRFESNFVIDVAYTAMFLVGQHDTVITVNEGNHGQGSWSDKLDRRLKSPYSRLRHNNGQFLLYAALDIMVDQSREVIEEVSDYILHLEDELQRKKHSFSIEKLRRLKNDLFNLPRVLKPAREVLRNMIQSPEINKDTTVYLRDVLDHVLHVLDEVELQLSMCRLLAEDYREAKSEQMNYVVYTLSIVTTVFLPAQFLTGVYGMNFDNMPELHEKYGYYFFWIFVIFIAALLQMYFRFRRWI